MELRSTNPDVQLLLESADAFEEGVLLTETAGGGLYISVEEEQAVDSRNVVLVCSAHLSHAQVLILRNWLNKLFG